MEAIDGHKGSGLLGLFSGKFKHGDIATYRKIATVEAVQIAEDVAVETEEGRVIGRAGDYVCIGVAGEKWPVARDIFEASYEPTTGKRRSTS